MGCILLGLLLQVHAFARVPRPLLLINKNTALGPNNPADYELQKSYKSFLRAAEVVKVARDNIAIIPATEREGHFGSAAKHALLEDPLRIAKGAAAVAAQARVALGGHPVATAFKRNADPVRALDVAYAELLEAAAGVALVRREGRAGRVPESSVAAFLAALRDDPEGQHQAEEGVEDLKENVAEARADVEKAEEEVQEAEKKLEKEKAEVLGDSTASGHEKTMSKAEHALKDSKMEMSEADHDTAKAENDVAHADKYVAEAEGDEAKAKKAKEDVAEAKTEVNKTKDKHEELEKKHNETHDVDKAEDNLEDAKEELADAKKAYKKAKAAEGVHSKETQSSHDSPPPDNTMLIVGIVIGVVVIGACIGMACRESTTGCLNNQKGEE